MSSHPRARSHNPEVAFNAYHATQVTSKVNGIVKVKKLDRLLVIYAVICGLSLIATAALTLLTPESFARWLPLIPALVSGLLFLNRNPEVEDLRRDISIRPR